MDNGISIGLFFAASFIYFIPSIVAASRGHHNSMAIFMLNFLLGWSVIGWIGSLVWSLTEVHPPLKTPVSTQGELAR